MLVTERKFWRKVNEMECKISTLEYKLMQLTDSMNTVLAKITSGEKFTTDLLKTLKLETRRVEAVPAHGIIVKAGGKK